MQPEFWFKGMKHVTRGDVGHEDVVRVGGEICLLNNDNVTFKEGVSLIARQPQ